MLSTQMPAIISHDSAKNCNLSESHQNGSAITIAAPAMQPADISANLLA